MSDRADVVVAGAGPAGCAAAIALARAGHDVLIADPSAGGGRATAPSRRRPAAGAAVKIGESLPAVALTALRDLGIDARDLEAAGARPNTGTSSLWGEPRPRERDAILDPQGHGWHLDRPRFDALLLERACSAGARLRPERVMRAVTGPAGAGEEDGVGDLSVRVGADDVPCRWIIDATGRRASIARALGARRRRADRLVAVYAAVRAEDGDIDARTLVASVATGWWYSALVAPRRRVVGFLSDADLMDGALRTREGFATALAAARHVLPGDGSPELESDPATTAAHGSRLSPAHGTRWVAVGDAALAFDPLSSQGIVNALVTGLLAVAALVAGSRDGGARPLREYERRLDVVWSAYESHRAQAYATERCWPQEPFWARRINDPRR